MKLRTEFISEGEEEIVLRLKEKSEQSDRLYCKISEMLNYSSIHNFSRAFKKAVGDSPQNYKKRVNHAE